MEVYFVIPCLNEASNIAATAHSLGFRSGRNPAGVRLILVDNGSSDATPSVLRAIRDDSPAGAVHLFEEHERGYVPPRHRGVLAAAELASDGGQSPHDILILQGDADTLYAADYIAAMCAVAKWAGPNTLVEATVHPPPDFSRAHPGFHKLSTAVDESVFPYHVPEALDTIVDDKACGYHLSTYLNWGGHRREYAPDGSEVHAETSRLFIRGKRLGGRRVLVGGAAAIPSRRKIFENPIRYFAAAGFPRDDGWWQRWNRLYEGPRSLADFEDPEAQSTMRLAIQSRRAHLVVLLGVLPLLIDRSLHSGSFASHPLLELLTAGLMRFAGHVRAGNLGPVFHAAFELIEHPALRLLEAPNQ